MTSSRKSALPLLAVCVFSFFGCATPKKEAEVDANGKKIEYVYYTPVGSNIPVRVRKDQVQSDPVETERDQEALRRIEQLSARTPQQNTGTTGP